MSVGMPAPDPSRGWDGAQLLHRAVDYTRGVLPLVTPDRLDGPTPCAGWDLRALLAHLEDSMEALEEAALAHRVLRTVPSPSTADPGRDDPVPALRARAGRLLAALADDSGADVSVDGRPLTGAVLAAAGALEVLVHGWDVAGACGTRRPLPDDLADALLPLVPVLVTDDDRPGRFGPALPTPSGAPPGERLLAVLGRPQRPPRRARR